MGVYDGDNWNMLCYMIIVTFGYGVLEVKKIVYMWLYNGYFCCFIIC